MYYFKKSRKIWVLFKIYQETYDDRHKNPTHTYDELRFKDIFENVIFLGSFHIIHALFDKNSFGFISTHDLALANIDEKDNRLINMHFREHIDNNKLVFDYIIKEGACPTTNALFIMKQEGLPVP